MRMHTAIGAHILIHTHGAMRTASAVALQHHERLDGLLLDHLPQALALRHEEIRIRSRLRIPGDYAHKGKGVIGPCCCRRNSTLSIG